LLWNQSAKSPCACALRREFAPFSLLPNVKKETTTLSRATIEQLEKDIPEQMKKNGVPGLAMAVIGGGKTTWVHGFG
jgi:CubicO group peptidase (beta-lactamase class C family)